MSASSMAQIEHELVALRAIAEIAREDRALRENARPEAMLELMGQLGVLEDRMNAALDALEAQAPIADRAGEVSMLRTVMRAIAERNPVWRDGDCVFCDELLGGLIEQWEIEMEEFSPERLGHYRHGEHKPDCLWLQARKAIGMKAL